VLDGGEDQRRLGGVVVQLGAPGHAGQLGDERGGGARPAVLDQALHGRLQQALLGGPAALLLWRPHPPSMPAEKQTVKPACFPRLDLTGKLYTVW
jgi:hypothetical protein